jgi:Peptidase inhibitor family I36
MQMERMRAAGAAGGMIAIAAAAALGAGASADVGQAQRGGCPDKTLCVWENDDDGGTLVKIHGTGVSNKLAQKLNNQASSAINNRGRRAYLYDKRNGDGDRICLDPHAEVASLGDYGNFNDLASSSRNAKPKSDCPIS